MPSVVTGGLPPMWCRSVAAPHFLSYFHTEGGGTLGTSGHSIDAFREKVNRESGWHTALRACMETLEFVQVETYRISGCP